MAVDVYNPRSNRSRSAAVIEDSGGFCERIAVVCALDEDFDGGGAGAGTEFFVFFGELVPVVAFGCGWVSLDGLRGVVCLFWMEGWMDGWFEGEEEVCFKWRVAGETYCLGV